MKKQYDILLIDNLNAYRVAIAGFLQSEGHIVYPAGSGSQAFSKWKDILSKVDIAIIDQSMPEEIGVDVGIRLKEQYPHIVLILLSGVAMDKEFEEAMAKGFHAVLQKIGDDTKQLKLKLIELGQAVEQSRKIRELKQENHALQEKALKIRERENLKQKADAVQIVYESPLMDLVLHDALLAARVPKKISILIVGETGTGKENLAKFVYQNGQRSKQKFISVNCATLTGDTLQSALFGHRKGAFTGAIDDTKGLFDHADKGVVFLDEVNSLSLEAQGMLLRVLEYSTFYRMGDMGNLKSEIKVDVQVISATNQNIEDLIEKGLFRRDLYMRLAFWTIELPSLKERGEKEIGVLVHHFVEELNIEHRTKKLLFEEAINLLSSHPFLGNIRELKNIVERAYWRTPNTIIGTEYIKISGNRNITEPTPTERKLTELLDVPPSTKKEMDEVKKYLDNMEAFAKQMETNNETIDTKKLGTKMGKTGNAITMFFGKNSENAKKAGQLFRENPKLWEICRTKIACLRAIADLYE